MAWLSITDSTTSVYLDYSNTHINQLQTFKIYYFQVHTMVVFTFIWNIYQIFWFKRGSSCVPLDIHLEIISHNIILRTSNPKLIVVSWFDQFIDTYDTIEGQGAMKYLWQVLNYQFDWILWHRTQILWFKVSLTNTYLTSDPFRFFVTEYE